MMNTKTRKPKGARSLAVTLAIAFFALSVVILLINGALAGFSNYSNVQETNSNRQQIVAQDAAKTVASSIEEKFTGLETAVGFANPVLANSATRKTIMESLLGLHPAFRQFALITKQGEQLAQVSRISQSLSPQFALRLKGDALTQTMDGKRYISPIYIDDATSEPQVVIAIPVKSVLGDYQGTLAAEINLKFMWDLVDQIKVGETGYAYVVDNYGNLISFGDTSRVLARENVGQISKVKEFVENPEGTSSIGRYTGLLGKPVVGSYVPLGTPGWAVVIELPTTEAFLPFYQLLGNYSTSGLFMAVLAGLAGIFMARRLSAPLIDLSNVATEIGSGNLALQAKAAGPAEVANVAAAFNTMTTRLRDLIGSLEQRVTDRTKALATSTEVSRRLSTILNEKELVTEVVGQVNTAFGYYHTQIYFYDVANENLVMAGGTGEAGEKMLAQGHKIAKGRGLVGRAAESNETVLVSDTSQNPEWLPNPLLPDTKAEIAIPISIGDEVLGVLDVQHNVTDGLQREDVDSLQSIANQIAVALQNTRLYTSAETTRQEAQSLVDFASEGIAVLDLETGLFTEPNESAAKLYGLSREEMLKVGPAQMSPPRQPDGRDSTEMALEMIGIAMQTGTNIFEWMHCNAQGQDILCEIRLVRMPGARPRLRISVTDITERRRNEELIRRQAQQQGTLNRITQKIQSATSVEAALQMAVRELGRAFGTTTSVKLSADESETDKEHLLSTENS